MSNADGNFLIPELGMAYQDEAMDSFVSDGDFYNEQRLYNIDFDMHTTILHRFIVKDRYFNYNPTDPIFSLKETAKS